MALRLFSCSKEPLHPSPSGKSLCHVQANVLNLVVQLFPPCSPQVPVLRSPSSLSPACPVQSSCDMQSIPLPAWRQLIRGSGEQSSSRKEQHSIFLAHCMCPGWLRVRGRMRPRAVLSISGCRGTVCPVSHSSCPAHPQVPFLGVPQGCQRGRGVRRKEGSQSPSQPLIALKNPGNVSFRLLKPVMGFFPKIETKESL